MVAREGGLSPASKVLRLSHSTISAQVKLLEEQLGEKLFRKSGRRLVLTETGRIVFRYADEIFSLGREMVDSVRNHSAGAVARVNVGVVDVVPKLVVRRILTPALQLDEPVHLVCFEDSYEKLLADLAVHSLHVVISDAPVPPGSHVKAFNHPLGKSGVSFFATPDLAAKYRPGFPTSLNGAPLLLPIEQSHVRRVLNQYLDRLDLHPQVVAEFADSALLKVFGADGWGVFPAPTVVEAEVMEQYGVELVGRAERATERFFAITIERRINHPAVNAICETARSEVFGG